MFDTILIANRGEIACRVIETAQAMGVRCVAVHSDVDSAAKHVAMADVAVCLGGASPSESYLRGDAIIEAALGSGAQAIHPGYGFLSENPEFVEAVEAAGLVFIGPSAEAIRAMGLKDAAKAVMSEAGVPVVPGYHGGNQDDAHLAGEAVKIGFPVLIKAVAGGGGKGMRLVESAADFAEALESARSEARTAFGNADVLVEKYILKPRHIEVQGVRFAIPDPLDVGSAAGAGGNVIEAPMPGLVRSVHAVVGDTVSAGDKLAVLEAMKMEHALLAPRDGVVAEVLSAAGDQVEAGAALILRGADEVAIFGAATEGFSKANINATIAESLERFVPVVAAAKAADIPVRGYVSCVTVCPYEGDVDPDQAAKVAGALFDMGCYEVSLGDTVGKGTPEQTDAMLHAVLGQVPAAQLAGHFHDTNGRALDNIEVALEHGLRVFDAAVGGLGGCPYAPGAAGNVATEAVEAHLRTLGFETGLNAAVIAKAAEIARAMRAG
ncbi:Methylcrotonoyl-CoA carboxylase subunit alpha, mitochondrial [Nymphon striatum]|nr:Methylcrotonoyl-CoA carboxylase subunit alpha, mitochondrial [Nymphon striatum]